MCSSLPLPARRPPTPTRHHHQPPRSRLCGSASLLLLLLCFLASLLSLLPRRHCPSASPAIILSPSPAILSLFSPSTPPRCTTHTRQQTSASCPSLSLSPLRPASALADWCVSLHWYWLLPAGEAQPCHLINALQWEEGGGGGGAEAAGGHVLDTQLSSSSSSRQCWRLSMRLSHGDGMTFRRRWQTLKRAVAQCARFLLGGARPFFIEKKTKKQNTSAGHAQSPTLTLQTREPCIVEGVWGVGGTATSNRAATAKVRKEIE